MHRSTTIDRAFRESAVRQLCAGIALALGLVACGDEGQGEVKNLKEQEQLAFGAKDFAKGLTVAQKGFAAARKAMGDKAPDTLYFAQAIAENDEGLHNYRGELTALKQEISLRAAAGQADKKLQPRRTLLIKLAEQADDLQTAAEQAVAVARGIHMAQGKDPQPVYRTNTNYPPEQYRGHVEGDVDIGYALDAGGRVTEAHVIKSTPAMVFDQAALESFNQWRFTPMLDQNGQPISAGGFKFTLAFRLAR